MTREKGQFITGLVAMILLVLILWFLGTRAQAQCTNLDVVLVADYSASVRGHEEFIVKAIVTFAEELALNIHNDVRFGLVVFDAGAEVVVKPNDNWAERLAHSGDYIQKLTGSGSTNIERALQTATVELLEEQDGRRKLIILISDGEVTIGTDEQTLATADQIRTLGIGICAVLIKGGSSKSEFMAMLSGGCYAESNYENLLYELKKLNICL